MWGALSDERTDLLFTTASGPHQRSHFGPESRGTRDHIFPSQIQRLPFSSPPTTRRATVEVFEPASTRETTRLITSLAYNGTDRVENTDPLAMQLSLSDGVTYSTVTCAAIGTDCAENTTSLLFTGCCHSTFPPLKEYATIYCVSTGTVTEYIKGARSLVRHGSTR
jgi:hypothetical protein